MRVDDIVYFEAQGIAAKYRGGATLMAAIGTPWLATKATNLSNYRVCKKTNRVPSTNFGWRLKIPSPCSGTISLQKCF
jgi:hypothetical protein